MIETTNDVLTIGPNYNLRGGVVSVLSEYAKYDKCFTFLPTSYFENRWMNILSFPFIYIRIVFFLLAHPSYKIVHIHGAAHTSFYRKYFLFLNLKYLLRRKIVYHIHTGLFPLFEDKANLFVKKIIHHMVDESDIIIALTSKWKRYFDTHFHPKRVVVLHNIVSLPVQQNAPKDKDYIQFLFLGKMIEEKGIFDLIKVISQNKTYFEDKIKVYIGGNGEIEKVKSMIRKYKLDSFVEYVGWVSGKTKEKLLSESDICILPSYYEGLPIFLLEAMSYKKPIISTHIKGVTTIVKNHKNGILIEAKNQKSLFEALKFFIEYPEVITIYGKKSFELVQDYLPKKVLRDLYKIYKKIGDNS